MKQREDASNNDEDNDTSAFITVEDWLAKGRRVYFDPHQKKMVEHTTNQSVAVFERLLVPILPRASTPWVTLLPGFTAGSYGYAKMDRHFRSDNTPRLYIEYVGQGDSDKPFRYAHSIMDRADLVEAQWESHGIRKTVLVAADYSGMVMLELLKRYRARLAKGILYPRIEHVLTINGGLFADGHTRPHSVTPLLASVAQRCNFVLDKILKPLWSKDYQETEMGKREMKEIKKFIRLRRGAKSLSLAAGFVEEHQAHSSDWDLYNIYTEFCQEQNISFHIVGGEEDPLEYNQLLLARERLKNYHAQPSGGLQFESLSGGHFLSTPDQASTVAARVDELVKKSSLMVMPTTRPIQIPSPGSPWIDPTCTCPNCRPTCNNLVIPA